MEYDDYVMNDRRTALIILRMITVSGVASLVYLVWAIRSIVWH